MKTSMLLCCLLLAGTVMLTGCRSAKPAEPPAAPEVVTEVSAAPTESASVPEETAAETAPAVTESAEAQPEVTETGMDATESPEEAAIQPQEPVQLPQPPVHEPLKLKNFKAGTWSSTSGSYYIFHSDGTSGICIEPFTRTETGYTYTGDGSAFSFEMGVPGNTIQATVTFVTDDEAYIQWSDGSEETIDHISDNTNKEALYE